jgi:hypothetical protein
VRHLGGIAEQHDQIIVRVDEVRLQADSGAIVLNGFGDLALSLEYAREIAQRSRIARLEPKGLPIVPDGFIDPPGFAECIAEIVVRFGKLWFLLECFAQMDDRFIELADIEQQRSEIVMRVGGVGPARDRGLEWLDGLVQIAERPIQMAEIGLGFGEVGLEFERTRKGLYCLFGPAARRQRVPRLQ